MNLIRISDIPVEFNSHSEKEMQIFGMQLVSQTVLNQTMMRHQQLNHH